MTPSSTPDPAASNPRPEAIRFAFVGYGARAEAAPEGSQQIFKPRRGRKKS